MAAVSSRARFEAFRKGRVKGTELQRPNSFKASLFPPSLPHLFIVVKRRHQKHASGDSWQLSMSGAAANARIFLHLWRDGNDLGISGPYGSAANDSGAWSITGSFGSQDAGS